jgi:hypothetical protein
MRVFIFHWISVTGQYPKPKNIPKPHQEKRMSNERMKWAMSVLSESQPKRKKKIIARWMRWKNIFAEDKARLG